MSALKRLWNDKMDIYRWVEFDKDGITKSKEELIHSDVKCHYSKGSLADTGEGVPTLINSHTLFCNFDTDIKEGDKVIITRQNRSKVTLTVGEGVPYSKHMEFSVKRSDEA